MTEVYGLVLAGGKSRRMGSDKALLQREGQSQLSAAVELLQRHLPKVFVSARADQADEPERRRFDLVIDRYDDMGPVAGILSAMDSDAEAAWLVVACDLPNIDDATIEKLLAAMATDEAKASEFVAYRSNHDGLPEPLCAIYLPRARAAIDDFVADGIVCPRKMLINSSTLLLEQPKRDALDNMNTPEDLEGTGVRIAS